MAGVTDQLIGYCRAIPRIAISANMDAVVATGEQVTAGLMAMALAATRPQRAFMAGLAGAAYVTDSQHGKARIAEIDAEGLRKASKMARSASWPVFRA